MKKMVVQIIQKMLMIVLLMTETYQKRHKNTDDNADDQTIFSKLDKIKEDVNSADSEDQSTSKNTEHKPSNDSKMCQQRIKIT